MNDDFIAAVEDIIREHVGRENAILTRDLAELLAGSPLTPREHQNMGRDIRAAIETINVACNGMICSDTHHGYWWASDLTKDLRAVEAHIHRARNQLLNASILKKNIQRTLGGQKDFERDL